MGLARSRTSFTKDLADWLPTSVNSQWLGAKFLEAQQKGKPSGSPDREKSSVDAHVVMVLKIFGHLDS